MSTTSNFSTPAASAPRPGAALGIDVVIMAAGKGTRMKSKLPKVLHPLAGWPLLRHVLDTAAELQARKVVVITGHCATEVEAACAGFTGVTADFDLKCVRQEPQLGTGHAVQQAVPALPDDGMVVVLSGDVPLTRSDTLFHLIRAAGVNRLALLTLEMPDPTGYGRIVRAGAAADSPVQAIVEHKDASPAERGIAEIYSGIMAVPARHLKTWLARLDNKNAQGEYYLTDIVKFAVADGVDVVAHKIDDAVQVAGVNSPVQLAALERAFQLREAHRLMEEGVRLADPARIDVRGDLLCAHDVSIDVNCVFEGHVSLGEGVRIGANCVIANAVIEAGAVVHPFTHIDGERLGVTVGEGALVGPFARLRPGARLGAEVHIGNFVEVKNSTLAKGAKANHLAYLGDATVGERVNYGAGSITANYDGANKHRTVIEADVHVGSNCVLVAPVNIGAGGTIGGGSTITKSTEPGALSVARGKQISKANWARPAKAAETTQGMTPEETITQLQTELAALRQEQQTFAATVTHDLRAPLRHIDAYAQLLREEAGGVLNAEALGFIDTITQAAHTLTAQLDALSAYAQLAVTPIQPQRVALHALVSVCIEELNAAEMASSGPPVHWEISVGEVGVSADPALLQQALRHVLGNAVFFSQKQAAPLVSISVAEDAPAGRVVLVVQDNGMGCELTHTDRLFSVFARMHSPRQLQGLTARCQPTPGFFSGLGMGLASTRRIVQQLGGDVALQSAPDAGCTVRLQLPSVP